MAEDHKDEIIGLKQVEVYALIDCGWDNLGESYSEMERCLGIFTSKKLVIKVATDYLEQRLNTVQDYEKEDFTMPETPITFEQLCDQYEYHKHNDYYGAKIYVYTYELDKREF